MFSISNAKTSLLRGASLFAVAVAIAGTAGAPSLAQSSSDEDGDVIVVTGTRITNSTGFTAPTPVTVVGIDDLDSSSATNIADGLNKLPVFLGSITTNYPTTTTQPGATAGQNLLALRRLGVGRTLVLLDGRRIVATNGGGATDIDLFPQGLVERVEVVTGGASAAYGSDAISGVVNFVLDTDFDGLKADFQTGISSHNDLPSYGGNISIGASGERTRLIASFDYFWQDGLGGDETTGREWFDTPHGRVPNPFGSDPSRLIIEDVRSSRGSDGGLITSGPLRGLQFLGNGMTSPFDYGEVTGTAFQSGGDGGRTTVGLKPEETRYNMFVHGEFDLTNDVALFAEGMYGHSETDQHAFYNVSAGNSNQYTVFIDNAYLPQSVVDLMVNEGITSFTLGRIETDIPITQNYSELDVNRFGFGAMGNLTDRWTFDTSYTWSRSVQFLNEKFLTNANTLYASADAVVDPGTGDIVCRSALSGGVNPNCIPRNLFGSQDNSSDLINYVTGDSFQELTLTQQVAVFNVSGDLGDTFHLGAGPIGFATGLEYRQEEAVQVTDPISQTFVEFSGVEGGPTSLEGKLGPYRHNNPQPFSGSYDIREGYVEVAVPVLRDVPFAVALDLNGAVRHSQYSTGAGNVTTWKVGGVYQVVDDFRLRLTQSRDIRSANTLELFNPISQITNNRVYNGQSIATLNISSGNTDLAPEVADTITYGAVFTPSAFPGLHLSLDYYDIEIADAIGSLGSQRIINECEAGNQELCSLITLTPQNTLIVYNPTLNLAQIKNSGYDFEALYRTDVGAGDLTLRALLNHRTNDNSQTLGSAPNNVLDSPQSPEWRGAFSARYSQEVWSLFSQVRWLGSSQLDPNRTINDNSAPSIMYVDLSGTYDVDAFAGSPQLFFSISNLLDQEPPTSAPNVTTFTRAANAAYDPIGRYYTVGVRVEF